MTLEIVTSRTEPLVIFTDGSCRNYKNKKTQLKKGHGGWAFIALTGHPKGNHYGSGFLPAPQTNNTAELWAVLEAFRWIRAEGLERHHLLIRPDSTYAINGMISGWRHVAAETNFDGEKNGGIWRRLHKHAERMPHLNFQHVKGHAGHKYNEMCDRIASTARKQGEREFQRANEER